MQVRELSLPAGDRDPADPSLVSATLKPLYRNASTMMVRPPDEVDWSADHATRPYRDPALDESSVALQATARMWEESQMLACTDERREEVAFFTVAKKYVDRDRRRELVSRRVWGERRTNLLFHKPPRIPLGSLRALGPGSRFPRPSALGRLVHHGSPRLVLPRRHARAHAPLLRAGVRRGAAPCGWSTWWRRAGYVWRPPKAAASWRCPSCPWDGRGRPSSPARSCSMSSRRPLPRGRDAGWRTDGLLRTFAPGPQGGRALGLHGRLRRHHDRPGGRAGREGRTPGGYARRRLAGLRGARCVPAQGHAWHARDGILGVPAEKSVSLFHATEWLAEHRWVFIRTVSKLVGLWLVVAVRGVPGAVQRAAPGLPVHRRASPRLVGMAVAKRRARTPDALRLGSAGHLPGLVPCQAKTHVAHVSLGKRGHGLVEARHARSL